MGTRHTRFVASYPFVLLALLEGVNLFQDNLPYTYCTNLSAIVAHNPLINTSNTYSGLTYMSGVAFFFIRRLY
jgi:hypothetical protein